MSESKFSPEREYSWDERFKDSEVIGLKYLEQPKILDIFLSWSPVPEASLIRMEGIITFSASSFGMRNRIDSLGWYILKAGDEIRYARYVEKEAAGQVLALPEGKYVGKIALNLVPFYGLDVFAVVRSISMLSASGGVIISHRGE